MNRITKILVALLTVALSLTLVACASSKADAPQRQQFSSPPTQEEIDEFRRTHPVSVVPYASMVSRDLNTIEGVSGSDIGVLVEITGEREMRTVVYRSGNSYQHSLYRARIVDIVFNNPYDDYFREYLVGEEVYVFQYQNYQFPMRVNDVYLLVTNNPTDPDGLVNVWNGLRAIGVSSWYAYYITDNSYIVAIHETSEYNNTGRSSSDFIDVLRRHSEALGWVSNEATPAVEREDKDESEADQDFITDIHRDNDESLTDSGLVFNESQLDNNDHDFEENVVEPETDDIPQPDSDSAVINEPPGEQDSEIDQVDFDDIDDGIDDGTQKTEE